jgi:sulfate permease, SulP family
MQVRSFPWRDDLRGGLSASILVIPFCISYGMLAFAPLGPEWVAPAIVAAFLGSLLAPLITAALGLAAPMVFVPRSVSAVVTAAFLTEFFAPSGLFGGLATGPAMAVLVPVLVFAFVLLTALFEFVFGLARLGRLAKYLPAPVIAGFQCGVALILLLLQVGPALGLSHPFSIAALGTSFAEIRSLAPVVAAVTAAIAFAVMRRVPRWPAFAIALAAGSLLHMAFSLAGAAGGLGPVLGSIQLAMPEFTGVRAAFDAGIEREVLPALPRLFGWAATAAVISTIDTLIALKIAEQMTERKTSPDHELMRVGAANLVVAMAGGMHSSYNIISTVTNLKNGGRSRLSTVIAAVGAATVAILFWPVLSLIPQAAIAGILIAVSFGMFDKWTLAVARNLVAERSRPTMDVLGMLATVTIVAALAVSTNLLVAVSTGIAIAIVSFIWRMSRSIVRRSYTVRDVQSRNIRAPALRDLLVQHGHRVMVFELEGPLFFGTAEKLVEAIEAMADSDMLIAIVDMERLNDIDSTGVRLLAQAQRKLARHGRSLAFGGIPATGHVARALADFGLALLPGESGIHDIRLFSDADQALEWAEDRLLEVIDREQAAVRDDFAIDSLDMLRGCSPAEVEVVGSFLERREYGAGTTIFRAGDTSRELFAIAAGRASVTLSHVDSAGAKAAPSATADTRLVTFSYGAVFGEFALLDRQPRSATVHADTDLVCYVLSSEAFELLKNQHPSCAIKLLANLGRELSTRLRNANQTIRVLAR